MRRLRKVKIVATLGPASSDYQTIRALFEAGADVFRLNMSHGTHAEQKARYDIIRRIEADTGRPIGVLADLQGPKLRVGVFANGAADLEEGQPFRFDLDETPGDGHRVCLPHREIFEALRPGATLLVNDGKIALKVLDCGPDHADCIVTSGGTISNRKGVNLPDVVLPLAALSGKDRADLEFACDLGADWLALSFVQRPEDLREAREIIGDRAWIMAKLEKPAAIDALDPIVALADGVMVARGDLGVELPPQQVPVLQRRIVRAARAAGKPVVVATQMLESMITSPVPTRAEASDVATAIYDGADSVMLSAESASGQYPVEAVSIMHRIICEVEQDPAWRAGLEASHTPAEANTPDAICSALRRVAGLLEPAATVAYTTSGFSALRASRERPATPILALTPQLATARRLALAWGVHPVPFEEVHDVTEMVEHASSAAVSHGFAGPGDVLVVIGGLPFGKSGSTNLLHIARIPG